MSSKSLYTKLNKAIQYCSIVGERFLPRDQLIDLITNEAVKEELPRNFKNRILPDGKISQIVQDSKKLFAILVIIGESHTIRKLVKDGLTDNDLPFSLPKNAEDCSVLLSSQGRTVKSFGDWKNEAKVGAFLEKQWLVLAPVLDLSGGFMTVDPRYPLPFMNADEVRGDHSSTVYKSELHASHQKGRQAQRTNLVTAVKVFQNTGYFNKERENLEKIRSIKNAHLIQHLICIDRKPSFFIVFPWADGGNLRDFWKRHTPNHDLILWSLQQMLGISSALESLHSDSNNFRHGDLKPANILHFKDGGLGRLVVADVGVSRIHKNATNLREGETTTKATTLAYEPPEVFIRKGAPRRRRYDIWSLACIYLEFIIWMIHGFDAIQGFKKAREEHFFKLREGANGTTADIHPSVMEVIESLRKDPRCKGDTALGGLINLITKHLLLIHADDRATAGELYEKLGKIVQRATENPSYIMH